MNAPQAGVLERPETFVMHDPTAVPLTDLARNLARVLEREAAAVAELREALLRQRAGVARDATDAVNASSDDVGRVLVSLEAVRRTRAGLLAPYAAPDEPPLAALERLFGDEWPEPLAAARRALREAAEAAQREAAINRAVLRRTIESGEAFLQALFSNVAEPEPTYRTGERPDDGGPGFLLDRKA